MSFRNNNSAFNAAKITQKICCCLHNMVAQNTLINRNNIIEYQLPRNWFNTA